MKIQKLRLILIALLALPAAASTTTLRANSAVQSQKEQSQAEQVEFRRDVLPILSNSCFTCHGPDQQTREGGFRLDQQKSATAKADSGEFPIVPGNVEASELIRRINLTDSDQMPPADQEHQLSKEDIATLTQWVRQGASWQKHWAFEKPVRQAPPKIENQDWCQNPIDNFVMRRLHQESLAPKQPAPKSIIIRRVAFDLTGLPPTIADVDAFLADKSENAYAEMVDRYLSSPRYGEHMATWWLDAARFADTNGYQNDFRRSMWPWRDWVINAFNKNKKFDEFTIEQLAGDLLENPTVEQKIATGFNRNHRTVTEGGSIEEEWHVENVVDRVETTSTVWMGLTLGCARCHDHKYDPISQREFYEFYAYFNNINEKGFHNETRGNVPPMITITPADHEQQLANFDIKIADCEEEIKRAHKSLALEQKKWESEIAARQREIDSPPAIAWSDSDNEKITSLAKSDRTNVSPFGPAIEFDSKQNHKVELENEFQFESDNSFSVSAWVNIKSEGAILSRMDAPNDYRGFDIVVLGNRKLNVHLIHSWPVNAIKITTESTIEFGNWTQVTVTYDGTLKADGVRVYLNGQLSKNEVNNDSLKGSTKTEHPIWLGKRTHTPNFGGQVANWEIYESELTAAQIKDSLLLVLSPAARKPEIARSSPEQLALDSVFKSTFATRFSGLNSKLSDLKSEKEKYISTLPTSMIMEEREVARPTYLLARGQYDQPQKDTPLSAGVPEFLPQPGDAKQNRLTLARWIVNKDNPLTARVTINRIWEQIFGIGLVESSENFGVQAPLPSHPELLDWLASDFVDSGWDIKAIQKRILMSATYRQSSAAPNAEYINDPQNKLLSRGPRFRLHAEAIRDNALAVSGLLFNKIGGPSVMPYQPDGLWDELAGGAKSGDYVIEKDRNLYRRSLYTYRKRTVPHPTITTFDGGGREICQVARSRTNTPLQALALLNDTTYVEAARHLAERAVAGRDNTTDQIKFVFRSATLRFPNNNELEVLTKSYKKYLSKFEADPKAAEKLIAVGQSQTTNESTTSQLAAITLIASVILNLDETITKE